MESLCVPQNRKCVNYDSEEYPLVEILGPSDGFEQDTKHTLLLYTLRGAVYVSYGTLKDYVLAEGCLMLFPPGIRISGRTCAQAKILVVRIRESPSLCDRFSLETIYRTQSDITRLRHCHLEANAEVKTHMEILERDVANGLLCVRFLSVKIQELFFYLRAYYTDDQLAGFNQPLLSPDARFLAFIWSTYRQVHNVTQFAEKANCSLTAFKVKFKKITGMPPSQWLAEQKARNVYHEISCGKKSLKEIGQEYHFASASHLGIFCRKNFGKSPGNLRSGKDSDVK
jgi:AraC-like DNA-binding protein